MESILKNLTLLKGNDICFECNEPKPTFVSFPTAIFICSKCAQTHKSFSQAQTIKSIESDSFSPTETRMLSLGGNKRFKKILDEYSISLTEPSTEYKYLTIAVHYYTSLLQLDVDKFAGKPGAKDAYQQLIKDKPIYELGAEIYNDKQQESSSSSSPETATTTVNAVNQPQQQQQQTEQTSNAQVNTNEIEEVKVNENSTGITGTIGGWFGYFSSAVKSTAQYVGIDGHLETAKNKINETMEYYGINEAVKNTSSKMVGLAKGAGEYIYNKGKEVSEMQIVKDTMNKVGEGVQMIKDKTNEFIGINDNNNNNNSGTQSDSSGNDNGNKISNADVPQHLKNDFAI